MQADSEVFFPAVKRSIRKIVDIAPADAAARTWVARTPGFVRPYLRLMRLDRPIGIWLLFWPCIFGLLLSDLAEPQTRSWADDLKLAALFAIGATVMRGAGCTYNDIVDRDLDARVARTRNRPIPSGQVSLRNAWLFIALQGAAGLAVLLQLNRFSIVLSACSLALIAIYPFLKRVTWWPQAWLGLTFNWGALVGFAAKTGHLSPRAFLLYAACLFWTLGYDTIYAQQDKEDDALAGVKSTARLFGRHSKSWVTLFYLIALLLLIGAARGIAPKPAFAVFVFGVGGHFLWQISRFEIHSSSACLAVFRANRDAGAVIALGFLYAAWIQPLFQALRLS